MLAPTIAHLTPILPSTRHDQHLTLPVLYAYRPKDLLVTTPTTHTLTQKAILPYYPIRTRST